MSLLQQAITRETICAVSTPRGPGGISVIRISGDEAWSLGRKLFQRPGGSLLDEIIPRNMYHGFAVDPSSGARLDEVLCVFFKGPHTYTAQDCVEIQGHCGPGVVQQLLNSLHELGARPARAGEFTLRAFLGGRIDLSQAEAVAQLVEARNQSEARLALKSLGGALGRKFAGIREIMLQAAAHIEAAVDFPDEDEDTNLPELALQLKEMAFEPLKGLLNQWRLGRIFREGAQVVLGGRPNVGKSSLFNTLLGRQRAIVTAHPGTTRDFIEESLNIGPIACRLVDTAGLHETREIADRMGQDAARERISQAELFLLVLDTSKPLTDADHELLKQAEGLKHLIILNKIDLLPNNDTDISIASTDRVIKLSAHTGQGVDDLLARMEAILLKGHSEPGPDDLVVSSRQASALRSCLTALENAIVQMEKGLDAAGEIASLEMHQALYELGKIDGMGADDEVIEAVFDRFCVGK